MSDEKIKNEMNLSVKKDIKVDSEELCNANDDRTNDEQANNDGKRWIII